MPAPRKIIEIDEDLCNGCGECLVSCAEAALELVDGKARLVAEKYCDGLGACLGECPTGALQIVERDADDFDEEAVEHRIEELKQEEKEAEQTLPCGCPSTRIQTFGKPAATPCQMANEPVTYSGSSSALAHWPVQIRLVPPSAPYLKNADLLVAADCTPVAYPDFHRDFLDGKVILIGCPKFDNVEDYVHKFGEIFAAASVKSVTAVVMEVPCCSGLPMIVQKGMELAGKQVPMELVVISVRGEVLKKERLVA
jgi:ferredoxin